MDFNFVKKIRIKKITLDKIWIISCRRKQISFLLFILTLATYNIHELFSSEVNYHNWFGYIHKVPYRNYYIFIANCFHYLNPAIWCIAFYIYFPKSEKARIIFMLPISFCIARFLNVISIKINFTWYDEILNFIVVWVSIRFIIYISRKLKNKIVNKNRSHELINACEGYMINSKQKIESFKKLKDNGKLQEDIYVKYSKSELKKLTNKMSNILDLQE